jgi:hypothetical protein
MTDPLTLLETLNRPGLLVQAARLALAEYNRSRHLRRLFGDAQLPGPGEAALRLMAIETDLEQARVGRNAAYSPTRHVTVLTALMHEAGLLAARRRSLAERPLVALQLAG